LGLWARESEAEGKDDEDNAVEECIVGVIAVKENGGYDEIMFKRIFFVAVGEEC